MAAGLSIEGNKEDSGGASWKKISLEPKLPARFADTKKSRPYRTTAVSFSTSVGVAERFLSRSRGIAACFALLRTGPVCLLKVAIPRIELPRIFVSGRVPIGSVG